MILPNHAEVTRLRNSDAKNGGTRPLETMVSLVKHMNGFVRETRLTERYAHHIDRTPFIEDLNECDPQKPNTTARSGGGAVLTGSNNYHAMAYRYKGRCGLPYRRFD